MIELADLNDLAGNVLSLFSSFTQGARILRLSTPLGGNLLAECVRVDEGLSQGYLIRIDALSMDAGIDLASLLGQPVLLQLQTSTLGIGLLTTDALRPFHGHVTAVELSGANGGFARYTLTVEPWTEFLSRGSNSRIFQDLTVFEILDTVFGAWHGQGTLVPAWRFDVAEQSQYPKRSITTQYEESDLAFCERLMLEEGLFHFFEHSGDAASPALGGHTMVIADHNGVFQPNQHATVSLMPPGFGLPTGSFDRWENAARWQTNLVEMSSWDYRAVNARPVSASGATDGGPLTSRDTPGAYAYASREQGQRIADNQARALDASRATRTGAGTVRTLAAGTTFTLVRSPSLTDVAAFVTSSDGDDDDSVVDQFLIVRSVHLMYNNLGADLLGGIVKLLGQGVVALASGKDPELKLSTLEQAMRPAYRNRIDAIPADVPYRSSGRDGHGRLLHPRPTVRGQQSAIVVGPAGAVIHTDRDHRIKVQFHWQRGAASHSRLGPAVGDTHSGAPGDDTAGTWVRLATPVAGANWGSNTVPRIGQEVLIDFFEGNIDRPVVIGSLYNGRGQADAQNNQVAQGACAATGNAPAWFPGESGGHAHPAALSGIKTQAMSASQSGGGAYNQLVFDDSPGQARVALQRHARAHEGTAELNLGHLRHQSDNQRLQPTGFGAELKTAHSAALRAGQGLLLSADARDGASGGQLDSAEAQSQIASSRQLQLDMASTAQKHNAQIKQGSGEGEPEAAPEQLPAIAGMAHSADVVGAMGDGGAGGDSGSGQGTAAAYSEPHLQLSSPAGIAATTPADAIFVAGNTGSISAGQDINLAAQGNLYSTVKGGISLFTYGKASNAGKPNQELGIKLHAASGKVSVQSQSDVTKVTADKAITVASVTRGVTIAAREHVLMTAQGAYLKLEGGNIMIHGPGTMAFKASAKELAGPADGSAPLPVLAKPLGVYNEAFVLLDEHTGAPMAHVLYVIESASGVKIEGRTDEQGRTQRLFTAKPEQLSLHLIDE
jgi:uncharacterized protein involved in type VI secretion and phage assembly/uncharacterized protein (DUF2345 family)